MSGPLQPVDEFDAVRMVVEVLKTLKPDEQARVIRWAQEKLGIISSASLAASPAATSAAAATLRPQGNDIRSFMQTRNPRSDVQFATAVAYYYAFVAPESSRKSEINGADLKEATRLVDRERLHSPIVTLHNALKTGYLDKGSKTGTFRINTVGENLIAMSLPTANGTATARPARPIRKKAKARKSK